MSLSRVRHDTVTCSKCERLRSYCAEIGRVKRAAFRNATYWARPVPGFGDPNARMLILGLAPARRMAGTARDAYLRAMVEAVQETF